MEKVKVFTPEKSEKQKRIHFSKNNKKNLLLDKGSHHRNKLKCADKQIYLFFFCFFLIQFN